MSFRDLFGDRFSYQRRSRFKTRLGRYKSDLCLATIVQGFASRGNDLAAEGGHWGEMGHRRGVNRGG